MQHWTFTHLTVVKLEKQEEKETQRMVLLNRIDMIHEQNNINTYGL